MNERAKDYLARAYRLQESGNLDRAIAEYTKSIDVEATAEAYTFRGWAKSIRHDYDAAILDCRTAITLDPDFGNPYNDIGAYLIAQGCYEDAVPYLQTALTARRYATPHFPCFNLGRVYEKTGDWFRALDFYKQSVSLSRDYDIARDAMNRLQALLN